MLNLIYPGNRGKLVIQNKLSPLETEKPDSVAMVLFLLVSYWDLKLKGILDEHKVSPLTT